jgi:predicted PolB exonuclease-like 3'-5' exonuclease
VPFVVFDVETRIDKALVNAVLHRGEDPGDEEAYARTREELAQRGSDFFPVAFHVPVSLVVGEVDDARVLTEVRALGDAARSEASIVSEFWHRLESRGGTLVSFNGRGFDLPVMELAALRHGRSIPRYFGGAYRERDTDSAHYDLYDFVTNHGMYGVRGGFQLLTRLVGLPGKGSVDGGDVQGLWEAGRGAEIDAYCRRDVVQTYFLFLRLELGRGRISQTEHDAALAAAAAFRDELG